MQGMAFMAHDKPHVVSSHHVFQTDKSMIRKRCTAAGTFDIALHEMISFPLKSVAAFPFSG
jgi:hypothetical protein